MELQNVPVSVVTVFDDTAIGSGLLHTLVTGWSGSLCGLLVHDGFEIKGCQLSESGLSASSVVGAFDPPHDCHAELFVAVSYLLVKDILLEESEEAFHSGVVPSSADTAHASNQPMAC